MSNKQEVIEISAFKHVPLGWEKTTLGQIGEYINGRGFKKSEWSDTGLPIIRIQDLTRTGRGQNHFNGEIEERHVIHPGDLLISWSATLGAYIWDGPVAALNQHIFKVNSYIHKKFHYYLIHFILDDLYRHTHGSGMVHITKSKFEAVPIGLPPENQQKRIVAEIEKQFSRLDKAVNNLKRVKANLKRYKASVLKAAVEGRLTEEWREKHLPAPNSRPGKFYTYAILCEDKSIYIGHTDDIERRWKEHLEGKGAEWTKKHTPTKIAHYEEFDTRQEAADREKWLKTGYGRKWLKRELAAGRTRQAGRVEPADKLLERILTERRKKWEEAELAKMKAKGKMPRDDKWKEKYKEPVGPGKQNIDNLPNAWVIVTLDQVSAINQRIDKKEIPDYLEVSFVPMSEVGAENGYINVKNTKPFAEVKKGFTNFLEGDVLFAKITPCMENGKMAVVPKLSNGYGFGSTEFHVIRPSYGINPYFIYYLVSNLSYRKEAAHRMTGAVGQKRVPVSFLLETTMPLPPIKEQDQIVREVQRRISIIDGINSMIEIALKHADHLRQSILKKAFSGELVPQDAGDEPVEALLNHLLLKQDKAGKKVAKKVSDNV